MFRGDLTFEEAWEMPRRELLMLADIRSKSMTENPEATASRDLEKSLK